MKTPLFKQTLADYKNKLSSTIGTFMIFAALYLVITIPCILLAGYSPRNQNDFFDYLNRIGISFHNTTISFTMIFASIFFVIHNIRNNYVNYLPFSSSRNSYMLSDTAIGFTFGSMFALVQLLAESILRFAMANANGHYVFQVAHDYSISIAFQNATTAVFLCSGLFFMASALVNCLVRKKYHMILINAAIVFAFVMLISLPFMLTIDSEAYSEFVFGYETVMTSWWGLSLIAIVHLTILQTINYIYMRKGGFRR